MDPLEVLKVLGSLAGVTALAWRVLDGIASHLRIAVVADAPAAALMTMLTTVENKGNRPKGIAYACLLIGPEPEDPVTTARTIAKSLSYPGPLNYTNDLRDFRPTAPYFGAERALIPIRFYYIENVDTADETLTYRVPITLTTFAPGTTYSVRFFLFPAEENSTAQHTTPSPRSNSTRPVLVACSCFLVPTRKKEQSKDVVAFCPLRGKYDCRSKLEAGRERSALHYAEPVSAGSRLAG